MHGWSKQHVFYYLKKHEKAGLVRRKVRSSAVFYELTNRGQKALTSCEGVVYSSGVYRLHKYQVLFPIVREGFYPADNFRKVENGKLDCFAWFDSWCICSKDVSSLEFM